MQYMYRKIGVIWRGTGGVSVNDSYTTRIGVPAKTIFLAFDPT